MPSKKVHVLKQVENTPDGKPGEPVDEALENGPLAKRVCRDSLCCLLFIVFMGGMIGIAGYSISNGNPNLIGRGYDNEGKICGISSGYEDYPYLYFAVPDSESDLTKTVCAKSCPTSSSQSSVDCYPTTMYPTCVSAPLASNPFFIYASTGYVDRFCLPDVSSDASNAIFDSDLLQQWISDIRETWPVIACSIGVAFLIGFVYMIFLRYCSGILTWAAILCFIAGMGVLGWRFYKEAQNLSDEMDTNGGDSSGSNTENTVLTDKIVAYVCWGVAVFTVLAVLCLFSRIRLAIAIIKAAADFIKDTPSIFLLPPFMIIILVIFYVYWGATAIFLVSSGDTSQIQDTPFGSFTFNTTLKRLLIYHLLGLLWFNAFVLAACQFIVASATALWYFSQGTGQNAPKTIRTSIYRFFRYHFGSIAFGSLILAIVQLIRLILAYMEQQAKKMVGKDGRIVRFVLGCLQCYLACFERFIKFLNKNAYIQIALSGKSFCGAAKDAFSLIMRNPLRMGVVTSLGAVFVLFGKVFIASLTALAGFLVITRWSRFSDEIYSPFIPTIVMFVFAYGIGAIFMTMYGLAADTILACFILDEEINSKKNAPARHCPSSLREFLDNHAKK